MPTPQTSTPSDDPLDTTGLYDLDDTTRYRSWCHLCIVAGVHDDGELCKACAYGVLTGRVNPDTGLTIPSRYWSENRP